MSGDGARKRRSAAIGLWGTFDVDNYGDLLLAHVGRVELARRLPGAEIRTFAPFGWFHPVSFEGIEPAEPLGAWTDERAAQLAGELDLVVIGGGDIIHREVAELAHAYGIEPDELRRLAPSRFFIEGLGPELEDESSVVWNAVGVPLDFSPDEAVRVRRATQARPYLSVRDDLSRRRLERAGVDRDVTVVPDPAVLLPRVFPSAQLEEARGYLRLMDRFPRRAPALAIQGNGGLAAWIPALADVIKDLVQRHRFSVVTIELGPCHGDGDFAHALHRALRGSVPLYHVPGTARLEHVAAAIEGSTAFVGSSLHGAITAFAYERPFVMLHGHRLSKMEGFAALAGGARMARGPNELARALDPAEMTARGYETLPGLQARVDAHFDRVARLAEEAAGRDRPRHPPATQIGDVTTLGAVLMKAHTARERRLAAERESVATRLEEALKRESQLRNSLEALDQERPAAPRPGNQRGGTLPRRVRAWAWVPRLLAHRGPRALDQQALERAVRRAGIGAPPRFLEKTGSTNTEALALAETGAPAWTVVAAGHQTAGRGRLGRSWADAPGSSLLFSVILRPTVVPEEAPLLGLVAAIEMIGAIGHPALAAKWPNDLVFGDRKVGGILAEAVVSGGRLSHVVIGVGVNIATARAGLPGDLDHTATSLSAEGAGTDRELILARFLEAFRGGVELPAHRVLERYRSVCVTLGRWVRSSTTSGDVVEGRAVALDDQGGLVIERDGRRDIVAFGEVTHLR